MEMKLVDIISIGIVVVVIVIMVIAVVTLDGPNHSTSNTIIWPLR